MNYKEKKEILEKSIKDGKNTLAKENLLQSRRKLELKKIELDENLAELGCYYKPTIEDKLKEMLEDTKDEVEGDLNDRENKLETEEALDEVESFIDWLSSFTK